MTVQAYIKMARRLRSHWLSQASIACALLHILLCCGSVLADGLHTDASNRVRMPAARLFHFANRRLLVQEPSRLGITLKPDVAPSVLKQTPAGRKDAEDATSGGKGQVRTRQTCFVHQAALVL